MVELTFVGKIEHGSTNRTKHGVDPPVSVGGVVDFLDFAGFGVEKSALHDKTGCHDCRLPALCQSNDDLYFVIF